LQVMQEGSCRTKANNLRERKTEKLYATIINSVQKKLPSGTQPHSQLSRPPILFFLSFFPFSPDN
jgi:hypothetical protein